MRRKVVFLTRPYPRYEGDPYGAEVLYLAEAMAEQGTEVVVITTTYSPVKGKGIKVHSFPLPKIKILSFILSYLWATVVCLFYAWFGQMSILNLQWAYPLGPIGLVVHYLSPAKLVTTARGSDLTLYGTHPRWKPIIAKTLQSSEGVITVGSGLRDIALNMGVRPRQLTIIPSVGVDLQKFTESGMQELPGEGVKLLYVGGLVPVKGLDILFEACTELVRLGENFHLYLVGKGQEREALMKLGTDLGIETYVTFVGEVPHPQVAGYFNSADVFVLPSRQEGLGIVLLEAMAARTVIVASDVGGIPDLVKNGENGLLVAPENPEELARALSTVIREPQLRDSLADKGLQIVKRFTYEQAARDTLSFINEHVEHKR